MKEIVLIDNYDSFTYNLVHYFETLGVKVIVYRNDEFDIESLEDFENIVLSPGPGLPKEAGLLIEVIQTYAHTKKILGICLGLQAIVEAFGGTLKNLPVVYHGVASTLHKIDENDALFLNVPQPIQVGRYHSWVANKSDFPNCLKITAFDHEHQIMAIKHKELNIHAVQFHPESILTPHGLQILKNWIDS